MSHENAMPRPVIITQYVSPGIMYSCFDYEQMRFSCNLNSGCLVILDLYAI
jgi:hypothetical protein